MIISICDAYFYISISVFEDYSYYSTEVTGGLNFYGNK